ncbi:membrane protein [Pilimelia terevasa]|uniref:Membrane protein n=1 Tax=Pilimelia terevasa TaxID=53372 RepID=A0A8J3FEA4_9ACTN|nr:thioredoxin domain-containing protein [Pilimelia terevasa]GGK15998.1 membrane protein [Pilimelia terevasa]
MSKRSAGQAMAATLAAEKRRQRTFWASLIAVAVLLVAGIVGYGVYASNKVDEVNVPKGTAQGDDTGIPRGSGKVKVDVYVDFMCPACRQFEAEAKATLNKLVDEKKITLVTHPVAILDHASKGTEYSTRASAALGCAADGGKFVEYTDVLFARQPEELTPGLPNDTLAELGRGVGLGPDFTTCIESKRYRGWARHVTETASRRGLQSTPHVTVNDKKVESNSAAITAAVAASQ